MLDLDPEDQLDFALIRIDAPPLADGSLRRFLTLAARAPIDGENVYVIHHPRGLPTKVSDGCEVYKGVDTRSVEHNCQTLRGSSGAPVIASNDGQVVGLHYKEAFPEDTTQADIGAKLIDRENRGLPPPRNGAKPSYLLRERLKSHLP